MQFKHLLGLAVVATIATLTLAAPTELAEPSKEITVESKETTAEVKEASTGEKPVEEKGSTNDVKEVSADVKETTVDVRAGPVTDEVKDNDINKITEKKDDEGHEDENMVKDLTNSGETVSAKSNLISLKDVIETVKEKEESLVELEKKLREATETATSSSKPSEPDTSNKKIGEIITQFLNELVQIPMVVIHAVSNAISSFTGNRIALTLNKSPPK